MVVYGPLALILNSLFLAALTFFFATFILLLLRAWIVKFRVIYAAKTRQSMFWLIVVAPWCVSCLAFSILMSFPASSASPGPLHFHHNSYEYQVLTWHSWVPIIFLAVLIRSLFWFSVKTYQYKRKVQNMQHFVGSSTGPNIALRSLHAFTLGLFHPKIYLSEGLRECLSDREFSVVKAHEYAHLTRKDPLKKYIFSFFLTFFPSVFAEFLRREMALAIEQGADEYAASQVGDKFIVARTVVRMEQLKRAVATEHLLAGQCAFSDGDISQRVRYLVDGCPHHRFPFTLVIGASLCVLLGNFISVDIFHHFAELVFQH